ncbi:hypothetical protein E5S13_004603 [Escherichia coli]|uniref:hypothetical protein n=1 Tax=Escherichia coli TaxID=562 RepID=UPI00169DB5F9|nr:hypothetical protein [Escherichia coli]EEQ1700024.1 hypothetical protein [Escherichia coli]EEQ3959116.1 hypothetical protein [Escherichia coli]EEQ4526203.1 hypothetical protein [Escherichia coli]EER3886798.1 hypothetical protein [Escherichia coli]EES3719148.1 hypothetical protein [Escherichia coli]
MFAFSFEQDIPVGEDPFAVQAGAPLQEVWLGKVPETGKKHVQDYRLIWKAEGTGDESGG